jgi:hypothetical protein
VRGDLALEYMTVLVVISLWRDIIPHGCVNALMLGVLRGETNSNVSVSLFHLSV